MPSVRSGSNFVKSLGEAVVWGYGERPSRIVATAIFLLSAYTVIYFLLLSPARSLFDCAYLSIVTFTTLGYGDITPTTTLMKMMCGSEAAIGAFIVGLVVAGFANKSRY
jgi:Ion channel